MAERAELSTPETPSAAPAAAAAAALDAPGASVSTAPGSDRAAAAIPKTRSRRDGAAVALDEEDRRLLNLMQGSFPIEARPYAAVARAAGVSEERILERVGAAAGAAHHPPGHPDLRHARAGVLLDAGGGQGRSRAPVAGGEDRQLPPGRLAQLPAQPRLQHVVHARHRARLAAWPGRHAGASAAS